MQETEKNQLMFSLLQSALFDKPAPEEIEIPADTDWEAVLDEMQAQTVHGFAERLLDRLPVDPETRMRWQEQCMRQQARWYQVATAQQDLLELLEANEIPCVIIKGMAAAQYYPKPECRVAGDVDFLVEPERFEQTVRLLKEGGYSGTKMREDAKHHVECGKLGVSFEAHRWLGSFSEPDATVSPLLISGMKQAEKTDVAGFRIPVLPDAQNGLVLLLHIQQHLRSGLGLRQILDWMMFAREKLSDSMWQNHLQPALQSLGLEKLAVTVTALCQRYFGLHRDFAFCRGADPTLCGELLAYVLQKGNLGRKNRSDEHDASFLMAANTPKRLFGRLQTGGLVRWKAAGKHRILRPFAWLYQISWILRKARQKGRTPKELRQLAREGKRQRELIQKLGLRVEQKF